MNASFFNESKYNNSWRIGLVFEDENYKTKFTESEIVELQVKFHEINFTELKRIEVCE